MFDISERGNMIDEIHNIKNGYRADYDPDKQIVKQENFTIGGDKYYISTIDLIINFGNLIYPELYFETTVFKNGEIISQERYATRDEAIEGHEYYKQEVEKGQL